MLHPQPCLHVQGLIVVTNSGKDGVPFVYRGSLDSHVRGNDGR